MVGKQEVITLLSCYAVDIYHSFGPAMLANNNLSRHRIGDQGQTSSRKGRRNLKALTKCAFVATSPETEATSVLPVAWEESQ